VQEGRNAGLTANVTMLLITMRSKRLVELLLRSPPQRYPVHERAKPYIFIILKVVYRGFPFASVSSHMLPASHDMSAVTSYRHLLNNVSEVMSRQQTTQSQTGFRSGTDISTTYWAGSTQQVSRFQPMETWPASDTLWFWTKNEAREKSSMSVCFY
jgi:hypothetical protein